MLLTDSLPWAAHLCKAAIHSGAKAAASAGVSGKTASSVPAPALWGSCNLIFFPLCENRTAQRARPRAGGGAGGFHSTCPAAGAVPPREGSTWQRRGFAGEAPRCYFACSSVHGAVWVAVSRQKAPRGRLRTLLPRSKHMGTATGARGQHPELEPRSKRRRGAAPKTWWQL